MRFFTDENQTEVMIAMPFKEAKELIKALEKAVEQPIAKGKLKGSMPTPPLNNRTTAFRLANEIINEMPVFTS